MAFDGSFLFSISLSPPLHHPLSPSLCTRKHLSICVWSLAFMCEHKVPRKLCFCSEKFRQTRTQTQTPLRPQRKCELITRLPNKTYKSTKNVEKNIHMNMSICVFYTMCGCWEKTQPTGNCKQFIDWISNWQRNVEINKRIKQKQ